MDPCSGILSYIKPKCYIEDTAAAITRGLTKGGGQGLGNIFQESLKNISFAGMGTSFGDLLKNESANFFNSTKNSNFFNGTGVSIAEFINEEGSNLFNAINFDANQTSAKTAETIQNVYTTFFKTLDTGKMGRESSKSFEKAWEGIDLAGNAQNVGSDVNEAMDGFTMEIGEGIQKSITNTLIGVRNGLFSQMPYFLGAGVLTTAVSLGTPLGLYYLYYKAKHNIGRPKLATDVNQMSLFRSMMSPFSSALSLFSTNKIKPTYNNETTRRIKEIAKSIQNIRQNGGYFQNVLFFGPGGTGKTMISELLAEESGMSYVKMSGGDLAQYIKRGEHVTELNKLIDKMETSWRPWSTRPWILFIDESESLCRDRSKLPSAELLELLNAFLNRTGKQSKKIMLVMATNRMEDLDPAVLNRMDYKIHIGPPALEERITIIKSYLPQFFSVKERTEIFNETLVNDFAWQTEGFTGRSLFKLLNAIANQRAMTNKNLLTKELVLQVVKDFTSQEQDILSRKNNSQKA